MIEKIRAGRKKPGLLQQHLTAVSAAAKVGGAEKAYLPLVNRLGPRVELQLVRPGFYPAGGGKFTVHVEPAKQIGRMELVDRGIGCRNQGFFMSVNVAESQVRKVLEQSGKVLSESCGGVLAGVA